MLSVNYAEYMARKFRTIHGFDGTDEGDRKLVAEFFDSDLEQNIYEFNVFVREKYAEM